MYNWIFTINQNQSYYASEITDLWNSDNSLLVILLSPYRLVLDVLGAWPLQRSSHSFGLGQRLKVVPSDSFRAWRASLDLIASRCCSCCYGSLRCAHSVDRSAFLSCLQIRCAFGPCERVIRTSSVASIGSRQSEASVGLYQDGASLKSYCIRLLRACGCLEWWRFSGRLDCLLEAARRWLRRPFDVSFGLKRGHTGLAHSQAWAHRLIAGDCFACFVEKRCFHRASGCRRSVGQFSTMLYLKSLHIAFRRLPGPLFAYLRRTGSDGFNSSKHQDSLEYTDPLKCLHFQALHQPPCSSSSSF